MVYTPCTAWGQLEINTFFKQGHIKLIKSDGKVIYKIRK